MASIKDDERDNKLSEIREREEEDLAQMLADRYKLPYINLSRVSIDLDAMKLVPEEAARLSKTAVFDGTGRKLKIGVKSPNLNETKEIISGLAVIFKISRIEETLRSFIRLANINKSLLAFSFFLDRRYTR